MLLDEAVEFLAFIEQEFRPDGQAGEGDAFQAMKCRMPVEPRHVFFGGYDDGFVAGGCFDGRCQSSIRIRNLL